MTIVYKEPVEKAPCKLACPAGIDVPRYLRAIADGKATEALAVICEKIPFPAICGYVCFSPCQVQCRLAKETESPIAIRALKRFAAEKGGPRPKSPSAKPTGKKVAVVGSGPAGLTAAYYLAKRGHSITVFEALPQAGGMMRVGIPTYRLPREILNSEIKEIEEVGVEIKTNTKIESLDSLFEQGYNAVFLGLGAHQGTKMGINGEDSPGVIDGVTLLRQVNSGEKVKLGNKVAIIGGGNVAIDCSRTALRLGSKEITIIYRRTGVEMPASPEEVEDALKEGVKIIFLAAPNKISTKDGRVQLECLRMELGKPDASGRRQPVPIKGSEFTTEFDNVIAAIGQVPEVPAQFKVKLAQGNAIKINNENLATNRQGVFAGGDVVTGTISIINAIADGRKAATSIDKFLGGKGVIDEVLAPPEKTVTPIGVAIPIGKRSLDFAEAKLTEEAAAAEAKRCLRCDLPIKADSANCYACLCCQLRCSLTLENEFNLSKSAIRINNPIDGPFEIEFLDNCVTCGICARYCPYGALTRELITA